MVAIMLGYVRYDAYQIDGDAVSYMDLASAMVHGRWHDVVNGLWNPGYPALLALGKILIHPDRMHELHLFYWINCCIFLASIGCTWFFIRSILRVRMACTAAAGGADWALPMPLFYVVSYAAVFFSWQNEFSVGKIRVDGFFASLLLLAFAFLLRSIITPRLIFDLGLGFSLGLAYLVKSPGFVLSMCTFGLLAIYGLLIHKRKYRPWRLLTSAAVFIVVAGPYITALSIQKGRVDFGDSGKLNYAWYVSGTEAQHLLNNQPARFGDATIHLKHSEIEILSNPLVVYFPQFPHATYGPWFDPSYFNDGIHPQVNPGRQLRLSIQQSHHLLLFFIVHALLIAFLAFCFACGMKIERTRPVRWMWVLLCIFVSFSFAIYLGVHFLDRYVAGQFWIAFIATAGLMMTSSDKQKYRVQGAAAFFAIAILLLGLQSIVQERQAIVMEGIGHGWHNPTEYGAALALRANGVMPGDSVACFRACNTGVYWARLAGVQVRSEIYDPAYMSDAMSGNEIWPKLPNKAAALEALRSTGAKALVGYFEAPPPASEEWRPLAGGYYVLPLLADRAFPAPEMNR